MFNTRRCIYIYQTIKRGKPIAATTDEVADDSAAEPVSERAEEKSRLLVSLAHLANGKSLWDSWVGRRSEPLCHCPCRERETFEADACVVLSVVSVAERSASC